MTSLLTFFQEILFFFFFLPLQSMHNVLVVVIVQSRFPTTHSSMVTSCCYLSTLWSFIIVGAVAAEQLEMRWSSGGSAVIHAGWIVCLAQWGWWSLTPTLRCALSKAPWVWNLHHRLGCLWIQAHLLFQDHCCDTTQCYKNESSVWWHLLWVLWTSLVMVVECRKKICNKRAYLGPADKPLQQNISFLFSQRCGLKGAQMMVCHRRGACGLCVSLSVLTYTHREDTGHLSCFSQPMPPSEPHIYIHGGNHNKLGSVITILSVSGPRKWASTGQFSGCGLLWLTSWWSWLWWCCGAFWAVLTQANTACKCNLWTTRYNVNGNLQW